MKYKMVIYTSGDYCDRLFEEVLREADHKPNFSGEELEFLNTLEDAEPGQYFKITSNYDHDAFLKRTYGGWDYLVPINDDRPVYISHCDLIRHWENMFTKYSSKDNMQIKPCSKKEYKSNIGFLDNLRR